MELQDHREKNRKALIGSLAAKYDNVELMHLITIIHSISCVAISTFIFVVMRKERTIDRRQYWFFIAMVSLVSILYTFSLGYVVYVGAQQKPNASVLSQISELIGNLANNNVAFVFAIMMNFALFFGLYFLNMCSLILVDLAKQIE